MLRHENVMLCRELTGLVRYETADRFWFAALSRLGHRSRWKMVFAVTPGTLLGWHRRFIAWKWDYTAHWRTGRPSTQAAIKALVLRLAKENPRWGHSDQKLPDEHAVIGLRPTVGWVAPFDLHRNGEVRWLPTSPPLPGCPTCEQP